jgi:hypothetical protein
VPARESNFCCERWKRTINGTEMGSFIEKLAQCSGFLKRDGEFGIVEK